MRWLCLICASLLWTTVISKADKEIDNVSEASSNQRCCPCPEPGQVPAYLAGRGALGNGPGSMAHPDQTPLGTSLAAVDDCPCLFRDADSTGSASLFFPSAMRAIRPFVSLDNEKEETKPLLHPEVDLASSVLETLREATDEEYREAVARDSARSVSSALEPDSILEGARKLVSVIVNPEQESDNDDEDERENRNALSSLKKNNSDKASLWKPPNLTDILKLPSRTLSTIKDDNEIDSDVGASSIDNHAVPIPPLNKLSSTPDIHLLNIIPKNNKLKIDNIKLPKINEILNNIKERVSLNSRASHSVDDKNSNDNVLAKILESIPKINTGSQRNAGKENDKSDNTQSPSNLVQYAGFVDDRFNIFSQKSSEVNNNNTTTNTNFPIIDIKKTLLGAETVPIKSKSENRDSGNDFLNDVKRTLEDSRKLLRPLNLFNLPKIKQSEDNIENKNKDDVVEVSTSSDDDKISTEIIDTIPNSSSLQTNEENINNLSCLNNEKVEDKVIQNVIIQQPTAKTEIIDSLPHSSNVNDIIHDQPDDFESDPVSSSEESLKVDDITKETGTITSADSKEDSFDENEGMEQIIEESDIENTNDNLQSDIEDFSDNESISKDNASDISDADVFQDQNNAASELRDVVQSDFKELSGISNPKTINKISTNDENLDYKPIKSENIKPLSLRKKLLRRLENTSNTLPNSFSKKSTSESKESGDDSNQLSIGDLQNMSNSLLDKEKSLIDILAKRINEQKSNTATTNLKTEDDLEESDEKVGDIDISESNISKQMTSKNRDECLSDLSQNNDLNLAKAQIQSNEMSSEASERVSSVVKPNRLRASLLPHIVQPLPSLFNGPNNLFNTPTINIPDLFSNPLAISRTPNIFDNREKSKAKIKDTASKQDARMSSMASKSNSKTLLAPVNLLEDINLDVLQLKPLGLSRGSLPALPRLNLNSYKAKLPVPDILALKPVILESSVRNNKGIIGAAMTFGKNKSGLQGKSSVENTVADILGNPIALPSFDDLHEHLLENAQNLLSTPFESTSRNMIEDTLRSGQVLSENIKVQAKSAVNDLHKNIKNSFKGTKLGNTRANSNLLEAISINHEDLGDKLKGIRHDFSDRLEALRNNIFDQIPNLGAPMTRQSSILKAVQQPLQLSSKNKNNQLSSSRSKKLKFNTSKRGKNKSLNVVPASSVMSPKFVESPLSKIESLQSHNLNFMPKNSIKIPHLKSKLNGKPLMDIFKKAESSLSHKPLFNSKLKKENKVKITFETTPRPNFKVNPSKKTNIPNLRSKLTLPHKNTQRSKSPLNLGDLNESPSVMKPTHIKAPLRIPIRSKFASKSVKDVAEIAPAALKSKLHSTSKLKNSKWDKSFDGTPLRSPLVPINVKQPVNKLKKTGLTTARSQSFPRIVDDAFLTKVREALKTRLEGLGPAITKQKSAIKLGKTALLPFDMARSASSNVDAIAPIPEALKENTAYTCKMLCTKN